MVEGEAGRVNAECDAVLTRGVEKMWSAAGGQ